MIFRFRSISARCESPFPVDGRRGRDFFRGLLSILLAVVSLTGVSASWAEDEDQRPQLVKAAVVLNIARFVTWPETAFRSLGEPLNLCLFRSNSLGAGADAIRGKKVGHRSLDVDVVTRLRERRCHVLFLRGDDLDGESLSALLVPSPSRLTIVDLTLSPDTAIRPRGGVVTLVRDGTRIGFEVDLDVARRAGLSLSSELLKLARVVEGRG